METNGPAGTECKPLFQRLPRECPLQETTGVHPPVLNRMGRRIQLPTPLRWATGRGRSRRATLDRRRIPASGVGLAGRASAGLRQTRAPMEAKSCRHALNGAPCIYSIIWHTPQAQLLFFSSADGPGEAAMPFVSITRLRVRSWYYLPPFLFETLRIMRQAKRAEGNLAVSLLKDDRNAFGPPPVGRPRPP